MNKMELLDILKKLSNNFGVYELMNVRIFLEKDMAHVPKEYRTHYINSYIGYYSKLLNNMKTIIPKNNNIGDKDCPIDEEKYNKLMDRIEQLKPEDSKGSSFIKLSKIVVPYLVFIEGIPLHPVGMKFPGGNRVIKKNNNYYCPVKNKQDNKYSLCEFCICKDYNELDKK
ncbi:DUF2115 domain-containing protein [Methanococcus aeolicus]|uniref:UPF0305 protein Maeo_1103 n=1 Tax=Methanococcus aeolicus (strain ATCC BAA-1280 / DSM 17508 / OCM 812 / Nankai-3) TaxID=419665 RepID=A6UW08_META3|nr:DUF2115 domain-containing protein [Methanococcus aeolicus]ABR56680.1 conserved hypothetical protein [Methanococcus aeolicus Nankai-3]UXM84682.1 DUF2115 domain-containing protein [Methanococcus aeolicus]